MDVNTKQTPKWIFGEECQVFRLMSKQKKPWRNPETRRVKAENDLGFYILWKLGL